VLNIEPIVWVIAESAIEVCVCAIAEEVLSEVGCWLA
jgi:hypothetical protein